MHQPFMADINTPNHYDTQTNPQTMVLTQQETHSRTVRRMD